MAGLVSSEVSSWFVVGCVLLLSLHGLPVMCLCVLISSYKDTGYVGLGPTLITPFNLYCHFNDPVSECSYILRYWG